MAEIQALVRDVLVGILRQDSKAVNVLTVVTLPQLCQNYLLLYVLIGKMKVGTPALNA